MKVAVIGGGSTYAPELISGFISRYEKVPVSELWMMDINPKRLETVGGFCQRMTKLRGDLFPIHLTTDLIEALREADFIITQIRVGGQEARHQDILLGLRHDLVGQETTGVGGFGKAMRTIPVILDICDKIEKYSSPNAWVINFTNPSGIITQAIKDHTDLNAIGLCNVPISMMYQTARVLGTTLDHLSFDWVGLNHLGWMRHVYQDGKDRILDLVDAWMADPDIFKVANVPTAKVSLLESLNMIPCPYMQYFYFTKDVVATLKAKPKTRAQEVMEIDAKLLEIYSKSDGDTLPELMQKRGGEHYSTAALNVMSAYLNNTGAVEIVNLPNHGAIPGLLDADIVEVPAVIDRTGARPITTGPVEAELIGLMQQVKAYERLTGKAALSRSKADALWALVANPLIGDVTLAKSCIDEMNQIFDLGLR